MNIESLKDAEAHVRVAQNILTAQRKKCPDDGPYEDLDKGIKACSWVLSSLEDVLNDFPRKYTCSVCGAIFEPSCPVCAMYLDEG